MPLVSVGCVSMCECVRISSLLQEKCLFLAPLTHFCHITHPLMPSCSFSHCVPPSSLVPTLHAPPRICGLSAGEGINRSTLIQIVGKISNLMITRCNNMVLVLEEVRVACTICESERLSVFMCGCFPSPLTFCDVEGVHVTACASNIHASVSGPLRHPHTYKHTHTHTHRNTAHFHIYIYVIHTYIHTCIYIHIYIHIHIYTHICMHACKQASMHIIYT